MSFVDEYLAKIPEAEKAELERVRELVHATVPDAEEVKTYGMPGFKYKGKYLVSFAVFKNHLSLFPGALPNDVLSKLEKVTVSKGTIRFTVEHPIPEEVIQQLLIRRVAAIDS